MGSHKIVCIGGGNAAGYLAKELVAGGLAAGDLLIVGDEQVSCIGARQRVAGSGSRRGWCVGNARPHPLLLSSQVVSYERPALSKAYLFPEGTGRLGSE
jgi:hypothetical protein